MRQAIATAAAGMMLVGCHDTDALVPPTVDEDPALPTFDLGDTVVRGEVFGADNDPLVVLLHGGPGADYDGLLPLAGLQHHGFRVLVYDQRGSGLSRRHEPASLDADSHIADLVTLVDRHSPDGTAVLLGHSWGGQLAVAATQAHPDTFEDIVLLDPGPFTGARWATLGLDTIDMTATHLNDLFWSEQMLSPDGHARLDFHFQQLLSGQLDGYAQRKANPMPFQRLGYVGYNDVISNAMQDGEPVWDFASGLKEWQGTAHFVWGGANTIMDPAYRTSQEADFANVTSLTLDGVGHDIPWVSPDAVIDHVLEVL